MAAIDRLRRLGNAWEDRPQLIEQARQEGATWQSIADALHMTRMGVVKLHATLAKEEPQQDPTDAQWIESFTKNLPIDGTVRIEGNQS